jgi:hypothetical protein
MFFPKLLRLDLAFVALLPKSMSGMPRQWVTTAPTWVDTPEAGSLRLRKVR